MPNSPVKSYPSDPAPWILQMSAVALSMDMKKIFLSASIVLVLFCHSPKSLNMSQHVSTISNPTAPEILEKSQLLARHPVAEKSTLDNAGIYTRLQGATQQGPGGMPEIRIAIKRQGMPKSSRIRGPNFKTLLAFKKTQNNYEESLGGLRRLTSPYYILQKWITSR